MDSCTLRAYSVIGSQSLEPMCIPTLISVPDNNPLDEVEDDDDLPAKRSRPLTPSQRPTTRTPQLTLTGHKGPITSVAWRAEGGGEEVVSAGWDHCVRVWDVSAGVNTTTLVRTVTVTCLLVVLVYS